MSHHPESTTDPLTWRKSSASSANGDCVEVAETDDGVLVRNSKRPEAGTVAFTRGEMAAWVAGCKAGEFDYLQQ